MLQKKDDSFSNESTGKRKSCKEKKGNKYLKSALTEAAHSVGASISDVSRSTDHQVTKVNFHGS
jgi:hypothetical protein